MQLIKLKLRPTILLTILTIPGDKMTKMGLKMAKIILKGKLPNFFMATN